MDFTREESFYEHRANSMPTEKEKMKNYKNIAVLISLF